MKTSGSENQGLVRHDPAGILADSLLPGSAAITGGANSSFLLDRNDKAWFVLNGSVDLFLLLNRNTLSGNDLRGIRYHFVRILQGGIVFGIDFNDPEMAMLAVPTIGTGLIEVSPDELSKCPPNIKEQLVQIIENWVAVITAGVDLPRPKIEPEQIDPGLSCIIPVDTESTLCGTSKPIWFNPGQDRTLLAGTGIIKPIDYGDYFPLVGDALLTFTHQDSVRFLTTPDWLDTSGFIPDLAHYNRFITRLFIDQTLNRNESLNANIEIHHHHGERVFNDALDTLYKVLADKDKVRPQLSSHPFLAVMQLVALYLDTELVLNENFDRVIEEASDPVPAIARHAGFSIRTVRLESDWWQKDHGPLIGYLADEKKPCALLPVSDNQYELVNPEQGIRKLLDQELSQQLQPRAHAVFRPFSENTKLTGWNLASFGIRGGGKDVIIIFWMVLLSGILSLVVPVFTGWIVDPVIPSAELGQLKILVAGIIIAGLSSVGISLVQTVAMVRLEGRMVYSVQSAVWDRLLKLPASFFEKFTVGDLANRADSIDAMRALVSSSAIDTLVHSSVGLFSLGLMMYYSRELALAIALLSAFYCIFAYSIGRKIMLKSREILKLSGYIQGIVFQYLGAISKLRVAGAEKEAYAAWAGEYAKMQSITYEQRNIANGLEVSKIFFHYFAITALLVLIGWKSDQLFAFYQTPDSWATITARQIQKVMPLGDFVAFYVAFGQFLIAIFTITQIFIQLVNLKPMMERVQPILDESPENEPGTVVPKEILGDIEFNNVFFRYNGNGSMVLKGLNFQVKPGEFVAIIGSSGAGKSTIVRLLLGFDSPDSGSIFIDGIPISDLDKRALRQQYGVVLQSGKILSGTIYNNIAAGANLTLDDAWQAAQMAGLDKDIRDMPMGMDTYLGEGAATLSGGQRQRLMIARAVSRKPKILIFDEATSALDNETQSLVSQRIEELQSTRIVIAHRLSTIINADRIYAIDQGRVIEAGTYKELIEKNGFFNRLVQRQMM